MLEEEEFLEANGAGSQKRTVFRVKFNEMRNV